MDEIQPATANRSLEDAQGNRADQSDHGSEINAIFLTLFLNGKQLGVAYYVERDNEMNCAELTIGGRYEIVHSIVKQVSPTSVLLPTTLKNIPEFVDAISRASREQSEATETSNAERSETLGLNIEYLAPQMFSLETARQQVSLISVPGMDEGMGLEDKLLYFSSVFDVDTERSLRAIGGLLSYLLKNDHIYRLEDKDEPVRLNRVSRAQFYAILNIDPTTLQSLQIFHVDSHPLGYGAGKAKEGISLYGLLNRTSSPSGARLLKEWMRIPKLDMEKITGRLDTIEALMLPVNSALVGSLKQSLKRLKFVPGIIARIRTLRTGINDWRNLHHSARAILSIVQTLRTVQLADHRIGDSSVIKRLQGVQEEELRSLVLWVTSVVDFEESKEAGRVVVRDGFSEDIDELRRCLAGLDDFLTSVGLKEMQTLMSKFSIKIPRIDLIYYPQIGYLLLMDKDYLESDDANPAVFEDAGLEFMFSSPEHGYFKNATCYELDTELGDVYGAIVDLESKAIRYLESKVFPLSENLLYCHDLVTQLDGMLAMATVAKENNYCKPNLDCNYRGYTIENGRHPLQELVVQSFVGNETNARGGDVHVVTGPNYSGKSVYLKQVVLIAYLAHIGSFVPADTAHIGLTDAIYARFSSLESVSVPQSAFFIDCAQIARMIRCSTKRSLLSIDEFGKGTSNRDAISLLGATILHFFKIPPENSPTVFFATHFYHLLSEKYLPLSNPRLSTFSMEILIEKPETFSTLGDSANPSKELKGSSADTEHSLSLDESIVFLYRLRHGSVCVESQALQCALRAEIPRHIVRRALEIREAVRKGLPIPPGNTTVTSQRIARYEKAVNQLLAADIDTCDLTELLASMDL